MGILVLVVDDDDDLRSSIVDTLNAEGFQTLSASNGIEALTLLTTDHSPDIILVDMMMPKMDGLSFLAAINQSEYRKIPVLMMTGAGENAVKIVFEARSLVPTEFIQKPVSGQMMAEAIRKKIEIGPRSITPPPFSIIGKG